MVYIGGIKEDSVNGLMSGGKCLMLLFGHIQMVVEVFIRLGSLECF